MRNKAEIMDELAKAEAFETRVSKVPAMSYEEGVAYALRWVLGGEEVPILEEVGE